ncbi:MAG TPA: MarR family transcriptional regulator [Nevskiaceae bacterium]|nr:MarR family transcriptional regulator [Nevskiaceae bacterium]
METTSKQVCEDLLALLKRLKVNMAALAEEHDLTAMQLHALYALLQGEVTMGRVAGTLHCDASNVTGIVDRLVTQQLITRTESAQDRRTKVLQLTPKGQQVIDDITAKLPVCLGCTKLNATERNTLHTTIAKLAS